MREYWIVWGYSDGCGHTPGSDSYKTEDERRAVLDNKDKWRNGCYPSSTFETINGEVI